MNAYEKICLIAQAPNIFGWVIANYRFFFALLFVSCGFSVVSTCTGAHKRQRRTNLVSMMARITHSTMGGTYIHSNSIAYSHHKYTVFVLSCSFSFAWIYRRRSYRKKNERKIQMSYCMWAFNANLVNWVERVFHGADHKLYYIQNEIIRLRCAWFDLYPYMGKMMRCRCRWLNVRVCVMYICCCFALNRSVALLVMFTYFSFSFFFVFIFSSSRI